MNLYIRGVFLGAFLWIIIFAAGCGSKGPSVEEQVKEAYNSFCVLTDMGVSSVLTITLDNGTVTSKISRPSEDDFMTFFTLFTEEPLCQELSDEKAVLECLVNELMQRGCVRIATCRTCVYRCD